MGFEQYLKRYVPIMSIMSYSDENDRLFLDKIEEILTETFGEKIFDLTCLKMKETDIYHQIYAMYDPKVNPFDDSYVYNVVVEVVKKMANIGE